MSRHASVWLVGAALLLGAFAAPVALAVDQCVASGAAIDNGDGSFTYVVRVWWYLDEIGVPEEVKVLVPTLDGCLECFDPMDPNQTYLVPGDGVSQAASICYDVGGGQTNEIRWAGSVAAGDPGCAVETLHIAYVNTGSTQLCQPLVTDTGLFAFVSYGEPLDAKLYAGGIVIMVGDSCIVGGYTGPLPDCDCGSPVRDRGWGEIKVLYK